MSETKELLNDMPLGNAQAQPQVDAAPAESKSLASQPPTVVRQPFGAVQARFCF